MEFDDYLIGEPTPERISNLINKTIDHNVYAEWMLLFSAYNQANVRKLYMACRPCYMKVWLWYQKVKNDRHDI